MRTTTGARRLRWPGEGRTDRRWPGSFFVLSGAIPALAASTGQGAGGGAMK
jgi:hypothetical protein